MFNVKNLSFTHMVDRNMDIKFYPKFLQNETLELFNVLKTKVKWKNNTAHQRRSCVIYGDSKLKYTVNYSYATVDKPVIQWLPELEIIRDRITQLTDQTYTVCAVQWYTSGRVGINPHRDKEMKAGTMICGVSLGACRTLRFSNSRYKGDKASIVHDIKCNDGSLYIMHGNTNKRWSHSIVKDLDIKEPRISLTFRHYVP